MLSVMITAGTENVGKELTEYFAPHSLGVSRRNGYDIQSLEGRKKIAKESLKYDVFVNHAYSRDLSQIELLDEVVEAWKKQNKTGYIINTGTYGTYDGTGIDPRYVNHKNELDRANKEHCKDIETGRLPFRMTLIRPGMLDSPKSRAKAYWRGNGVRGKDIGRLIQYLYDSPNDLLFNDIVMESIVQNDESV